jgi:uncharacterized membrane protein YidH (DUF202 family)
VIQDVALLSGFLSTIGLIVILTLGLTIYGVASFGQEKSATSNENDLQTKKLGINLKVVFLLVHVEVLVLHLFVYQVFQLLQQFNIPLLKILKMY